MKVKDILGYIDSFAPFATAEKWDNSGLLIGDAEAEVTKAVVCLDVTEKEIIFAVEHGAQLIISHHPVIFRPCSAVLFGDVVYDAVRNGINVICAHTNLDKAADGVNDALCKLLFDKFTKEDISIAEGFLNTAVLNEPVSASVLAAYLKNRLSDSVSYCDGGRPIKKVAVCSGSGADFIEDALNLGCDAFVTGEASYHKFLDAKQSGISLFAAGHFETEIPVVNALVKKLNENFDCTVFSACPQSNTVIMEK